MKNTFFFALLLVAVAGHTQTINWGSVLPGSPHILSVHSGLDYGLTLGVGYAYQLPTRLPAVLQADFTLPAGSEVGDDFKARLGGQVRVLRAGPLQVAGQLYGSFRRYHSDFATIANFGAEASGTVGIYRPGWFVAGEFGFDKAIVSGYRHTAAYRDVYPGVQDGWYQPAMGGNYHYGLQTGFSWGKNALTLKAGNLITQDFRTKPTMPFYAQLGFNRRI